MSAERRKLMRRGFSYYMRVMDEISGKMIGHISDISTGGFKLDSRQQIPLNMDFRLRIDQLGEIANKEYLVFIARAKWIKRDEFDGGLYNVGFQITGISPSDLDIFVKMFNSYGIQNQQQRNNSSYIWG